MRSVVVAMVEVLPLDFAAKAPPGGPVPRQDVGGPNAKEAIAAEYARLMARKEGNARKSSLSPVAATVPTTECRSPSSG